MKSPYPYFGGKSAIMPLVWQRLGDTTNYVDPFFGSNAPLLSRPGWDWAAGGWADGRNRIETINDKDCFVSNYWRAIAAAPEEVARWADWPVNEVDLHARHRWLVEQEDFITRMISDPDYFDPKIAGWWVWGISQWIGGGWCKSLSQQRPHMVGHGMGIHRAELSQQRPELKRHGKGIHRSSLTSLQDYFSALSARLRRVKVCCGDWQRVLGPTPTFINGLTAIILDPPYGPMADRDNDIYTVDDPALQKGGEDLIPIADQVRQWAIENGDNPMLRIALFGYEDEHFEAMPPDWEMVAWKAQGGMGNRNSNGNENKHKERVWFSPHCVKVEKVRQLSLLETVK